MRKKYTILGGGLVGLTAAYYLALQKKDCVLIEVADKCGGLAGGFSYPGWSWELEKTYHHIFTSDTDILSFANEIGFHDFVFYNPQTASLIQKEQNYRIIPVDTPKDLLLYPGIGLFSKVRAGLVMGFLKISPFLSYFGRVSACEFLRKTMGEDVWMGMWKELFRKKFGKYAEKIVASFIWARINKRTKRLGYPNGGFQKFVDHLVLRLKEMGVEVQTQTTVEGITKGDRGYEVAIQKGKTAGVLQTDVVLSTLPFPSTLQIGRSVFSSGFIKQQERRKYLWAVNLILQSNEKMLPKTYWLSITAGAVPIMAIIQHTNMIDKRQYGDKEVCYCAWYVDEGDPILSMSQEDVVSFVFPYLQKINPGLTKKPGVVALIKAPFAQPIFDTEFVMLNNGFETGTKNIYVANLDMTYPFDRGTNYAVRLGKKAAEHIVNNHGE